METKSDEVMIWNVVWREWTLCDSDGTRYDGPTRNGGHGCSPDYGNREEAEAKMREWAAADKIEVVTGTRYGNGTVTREVYELCAYIYLDEDGGWTACSYDGVPYKDDNNEFLDVLDLHPEVEKAWSRANKSFCKWLDYADGGMGFLGFRDALESELGEDWDELDWIKWIG